MVFFLEFQRFYERLKNPTNNLPTTDLCNSGKEENYFLPPLSFCVFSSLAGCGWTVWKAEF